MTLRELGIGQSAVIETVGGKGALRQHFLDMGVIPGTEVTLMKLAPMGDPMELRIYDYELTLRLEEAEQIEVTPVRAKQPNEAETRDRREKREHPGLGEEGKFHPKGSGDPLPDGTTLTFALVGNQNSGKTTLFNQLTGSNQHVGNFPGVTVDRKDGVIRNHPGTLVTDLPGIYSMYLTMQALEMGIPTVVALNMMDEMRGNGGAVDINAMEAMLGVPVVPISAAKNQGIEELVRHAVHIAKYQEKPLRQDFCDSSDHGGAVHRALHAVIHLIEDHAEKSGVPVRFAASKVLEGDQLILDQLGLDQNEKEMLDHIALQMETERGLDRSAAIADMRFAYIGKVCDACVTRPRESREHLRSQKLDRILTGKYTALPVFIGIMGLVFYLTFSLIGPFLQDGLAAAIEWLGGIAERAMIAGNVNPAIRSLVMNGIFEGVGSVLSFLPIIVVMFFFLSVLEDSGYIARVAFVMDKLLRKIGLSGRSIVPMLIGFGCTVPAVMSTRTLPSSRDRKMTILLTPFMSCTAKLPIYGFFVTAFFAQYRGLIMVGLYLLGILTAILVAAVYKRTLFRGDAVPFVMELPNYRFPSPRNVAQLLWDKAKDFLQRAFSIILIATIVVWFLQHFDFRFNLLEDEETSRSILAAVSGFIAPILRPVGMGDWRIVTSLVSGFMAKENVVSIMQMLFGSEAGLSAVLSSLTAASMLVFSLLYTPCVAAVASIRREMGTKWAIYVVLGQCAVAWVAALAVRLIGLAFGMG